MNLVEILEERLVHGFAKRQPKIALVVEGGGMRSVLAAGMAEELQERRIDGLFDSYHGSSAGAIVAAYTAAGQAKLCADIFCNEAASRRFINPLRVLLGRPMMDLKWMIHDVIGRLRPLDTAALVAKQIFIVATSLSSSSAVIFRRFSSREEVLGALEASSLLPLIAGGGVDIDGQRFIDGGLSRHAALESAIRSGATHILMLLPRERHEAVRTALGLNEYFEAAVLFGLYGAKIAKLYLERTALVGPAFAGMTSDGKCRIGKVEIQAIFAKSDGGLSRLSNNEAQLLQGRRAGREAIASIFENAADRADSRAQGRKH